MEPDNGRFPRVVVDGRIVPSVPDYQSIQPCQSSPVPLGQAAGGAPIESRLGSVIAVTSKVGSLGLGLSPLKPIESMTRIGSAGRAPWQIRQEPHRTKKKKVKERQDVIRLHESFHSPINTIYENQRRERKESRLSSISLFLSGDPCCVTCGQAPPTAVPAETASRSLLLKF